MRFNPNNWKEVTINASFNPPKGMLQIMCSQAAAIFVTSQDGIEALAVVGTSAKVQGDFSEVTIEAPQGARAFVYAPDQVVHSSSGEILSSAERMPLENGTIQAIKSATRMAELKNRAMLAEMREERERYEASRVPPVSKKKAPEPDPEPSDDDQEKPEEKTPEGEENT